MAMTPETWRSHAAHARKMAEEYRSEGNWRCAERREAHADWYEYQAECEEWRISQSKQRIGEAA